jgi:hypothetical protein
MQQCIRILLFRIYMKLNMFQATHRPSSGALKLYWQPLVFHTRKVVGRCQAHTVLDNVHHLHIQQPFTYEKPEAASTVLGS